MFMVQLRGAACYWRMCQGNSFNISGLCMLATEVEFALRTMFRWCSLREMVFVVVATSRHFPFNFVIKMVIEIDGIGICSNINLSDLEYAGGVVLLSRGRLSHSVGMCIIRFEYLKCRILLQDLFFQGHSWMRWVDLIA